jgi:hypothetical protein
MTFQHTLDGRLSNYRTHMALAYDAGIGSDNPSILGFDGNPDFRFVPRELAIKCRTLCESFHAMHGYGCLPDMLWHSDARDVIECHRDLHQIFKSAAKTRCAKRANELLLLVATVIVALEVLARDYGGWGKRFPAAKREAEAMLVDFPLRSCNWFMDRYLYPSIGLSRDLSGILSRAAEERAANF